MNQLPPATALSTLTAAELDAVVDTLFEPAEALHDMAAASVQGHFFHSYDAFISRIGAGMRTLATSRSVADRETLNTVLEAHPRLGASKVTSAQSRAEQASLAAPTSPGAGDEAAQLAELNRQYEDRFPGLRYVVFVNGRRRGIIMQDMRARIERNDIASERHAAIQAMCEIARDRARKLQESSAVTSPSTSPVTATTAPPTSTTVPAVADVPTTSSA